MKCTLVDVIKVKVLDGYKLHLEFEDGIEGEVNISQLAPFKGIFEPLNDKEFFKKVSVNLDIGRIGWENGADLSPTYLRKNIK